MEPERPIEKVLRSAAAKRRAEAQEAQSFFLHPVDRRQLQAEIAKVYRKGTSPKTTWSLLRLWPQLGWGIAVVLGLITAASMMLPRSGPQRMTLAQNESRSFWLNRADA